MKYSGPTAENGGLTYNWRWQVKVGDLVRTTTDCPWQSWIGLGILISFLPRHGQWCQVHMATGELVKMPWKYLEMASESR